MSSVTEHHRDAEEGTAAAVTPPKCKSEPINLHMINLSRVFGFRPGFPPGGSPQTRMSSYILQFRTPPPLVSAGGSEIPGDAAVLEGEARGGNVFLGEIVVAALMPLKMCHLQAQIRKFALQRRQIGPAAG